MKRILLLLALSLMASLAHAEVQGREIVYHVGDTEFTGYLAFDDAMAGKRPGILVVHEWWGHNDYVRRRAEMLAKLGYTAFALDMYGSGKLAKHPGDATKFMQVVTGNMPEMKRRFMAGLKILLDQPSVDPKKTAAIGYCMGGGMALNMARAGVTLDGVVVFHGELATTKPAKPGAIKAQILVLTGADDPFVPPEQVQAFEQEMKNAGAHFRLKKYPGARHSFTSPEADGFAREFDLPMAYNEAADKDSWQQMQRFFERIFR